MAIFQWIFKLFFKVSESSIGIICLLVKDLGIFFIWKRHKFSRRLILFYLVWTDSRWRGWLPWWGPHGGCYWRSPPANLPHVTSTLRYFFQQWIVSNTSFYLHLVIREFCFRVASIYWKISWIRILKILLKSQINRFS